MPHSSNNAPLLEMRQIRKQFGGVHALKGVEFSLFPGEIHALIGENGAGKSTLMKILSGALRPDAGELNIRGTRVQMKSVNDARDQGIAMVYQELALVPDLTVAENIFLGSLPAVVNYTRLFQAAVEVLASIGIDLEPRAKVRSLTVGEQQLVAIARALAGEARVLIFDEPTATLTHEEIGRLFSLLKQLKERGVGIVYISHRLEEVFRIADRITILRDGERVGTYFAGELSPSEAIRLMVGREVRTYQRKSRSSNQTLAELASANLRLTVRRGEIVGLAGVVGSGRSRALRQLFGLEQGGSFNGQPIQSPGKAIRQGLFLIPADRKTEGLVLILSVRENLTHAILDQISRRGILDFARENAIVQQWVTDLRIAPPDPNRPASTLSGGNQQKVVLGKGLATRPQLLLLDEPTRGVDVGARYEIYSLLDRLSEEGIGIVISSSDTEELIGLCDRILVFKSGHVERELYPPFTYEEVVSYVTGAHSVA